MALPNRDNLDSLDVVYLGQPFVQVEARRLFSENLNIVYNAQPFVGAPAPTPNVYVNINGTWKQAFDIFVNVSNVWKNVDNDKLYVKVGASWKS